MNLELEVNRLLALAKLMEQALHSDGLWSFRTSAGTTPAFRYIDHQKDEIVFYGAVIAAPDGIVELLLDDVVMNVRQVRFTEGTNVITWVLHPYPHVPA